MEKQSLGQTLLRAFAPLLVYGIFTELFLAAGFRLWSLSVQLGLLPEGAGVPFPPPMLQTANALAGAVLIVLCSGENGKRRGKVKYAGGCTWQKEIFAGKRTFLLAMAAGACFCVGASGAVSLICRPGAGGELPAGENPSWNAAAAAVTLVCTGIMIPAAEELLFRRKMYGELRKRFGVPACAAVSSLLFGLYHGRADQGLYAGSLGVFLALLFERRKRLGACCAVHISANLTALALAFTPWPSLLAGRRLLLAAQTLLFLALFFAAAFCLLGGNGGPGRGRSGIQTRGGEGSGLRTAGKRGKQEIAGKHRKTGTSKQKPDSRGDSAGDELE